MFAFVACMQSVYVCEHGGKAHVAITYTVRKRGAVWLASLHGSVLADDHSGACSQGQHGSDNICACVYALN